MCRAEYALVWVNTMKVNRPFLSVQETVSLLQHNEKTFNSGTAANVPKLALADKGERKLDRGLRSSGPLSTERSGCAESIQLSVVGSEGASMLRTLHPFYHAAIHLCSAVHS